MATKIIFPVFLLLFLETGISQNPLPDHDWIGTGRVSARVNANGALISEFLVPDNGNNALISTIGELSVWMGGLDPAGNLYVGIQRPDTSASDFRGGFRDIPGSAGVWKVTKEEIDQHKKDFEEDGNIDVVIPAVFAWPGYKNAFSEQFNGFPLDSVSPYMTAPFVDIDFDGIYEPGNGEYPFLGYVINNIERVPTEMVFSPFFVKPGQLYSTVPMDCHALFFSYDCDDATFLEDAVFGYVSINNDGSERLDSFFLAFHINGDIGDPSDDYMGALPGNSMVYFYNADTLQGSGFTGHPPVVAFKSYGNLLDTLGNWSGVNSVMPIHPASDDPPPFPGTTPPEQPIEFYNYMTGAWRDGSPLSSGGTGYQSGGQFVSFPFTGIPSNPGEWSEMSANNAPGDRRALLSNGPVTLKSGAVNRVLFTLDNVSGNSISEQIGTFKQYSYVQDLFLFTDFFPPAASPFDSIQCLNTTAAMQPDAARGVLFPNPARTSVTLRTEDPGLHQIELLDILGRRLAIRQNLPGGTSELAIPVGELPDGLYFIRWNMRNGKQGIGKFLVAK